MSLRLCQRASDTTRYPLRQVFVLAIPLGRNVHEPSEGTTGEIHRPGVTLAECLLVHLGANSNDEIVPKRPAAHLAGKQEADAAEHCLLGKVVPGGEQAANALRQILPGRRFSRQRVGRGTRARWTQPSNAPKSVNCTKPAASSTAIQDDTDGTLYFAASASAS